MGDRVRFDDLDDDARRAAYAGQRRAAQALLGWLQADDADDLEAIALDVVPDIVTEAGNERDGLEFMVWGFLTLSRTLVAAAADGHPDRPAIYDALRALVDITTDRAR